MTYANGDVYEGEWLDDKEEGKGMSFVKLLGTRTYANKEKYEGEWKEGKRNGKGKFTSADGETQEGIWEDDKLITNKESKQE